MFGKKLLGGAALAAFGLTLPQAAHAQSTGTQQVEEKTEVVVTGRRGPRTMAGLLIADTGVKTRSVISQEFIETQTPGQTIAQTLNLSPGFNFTNDDAYGSAGGNIRIHGLDGAHIGLLIDGIPLNDAGNYSIYTNQQMDPELIEQASVNASSADADSATASSTGGTINYTTLRTTPEFGGFLQQTFGDFDYQRSFGLLQTGEFGPLGTSAWIAAAYSKANKFKGPGNIEKAQVNFRVYQPFGEKNFVSLTGNYNRNRNDFYYSANLGTSTGFCDIGRTRVCLDQVQTDPAGWEIDYPTTYITPTVRSGVADTVPASNGAVQGFYGLKINPSNTGTLRGSSLFALGDALTLTIDPSFNYTLANGGGTSSVNESGSGNLTSAQLRGAATTFPTCTVGATLTGKDLNGDGDCLDTLLVYSPSITHTERFGLNTSLIWNVNENNLVRFAYAYDYGRTRQTGEWGGIKTSGFPESVFSGKKGYALPILAADGATIVEKRDRFSVATLNQPSVEYRGRFMEDNLRINVGVRAPNLTRDLNQYCYTQVTSTSTVFCTTEAATAQADGTVRFASQGTANFFRPYSVTKKYDTVLPNAGASYRFFENSMVFLNYAEQQSAPKVDNLYTLQRNGAVGAVQPETSETFDFGYRYQTPMVLASLSGYVGRFHDRIVSTRDPVDDTFIDRNVGDVNLSGFDAAVGAKVIDPLFLYASASYSKSELQNDIFISTAAGSAPTKGKELVETPEWMFGTRAEYTMGPVRAGLQAKYVGERWVTDVNDLKVDAYTVADFDLAVKLDSFGFKGSFVQLNVTNLFNERYYASLKGTQTSSTPGAPGGPASSTTGTTGNAFAAIGAPRAFSISLRAAY